MKIVPLTEELVEQVAEVEALCFSEPWSKEAYKDACVKKEYHYLVAVSEQNQVIGMCGLLLGPFEAEVLNVGVHPAYRGQGIAKMLLASLIEEGDKLGVKEYTLEVRVGNASAIHVYELCGFVGEGIRPGFYTKPTEDALIMWKR